MKPNDKAIEAAIAEGRRWDEGFRGKKNQIPSWQVLRQAADERYGYDVIAEFNNRKDRGEALLRLRAEAMVDAAYAAQFKSEDYAGLVKMLRYMHKQITSAIKKDDPWEVIDETVPNKAADALETLLADREASREQLKYFGVLHRQEYDRICSERDALAARLAPVEDEALLKMVDEIIYVRSVMIGTSTDEIVREVITHIRPHIEAAERERVADQVKNWGDEPHFQLLAAAIRSGE